MNATDLPIPEPCDADWNTMTGDDRRRFCGACQKHVTDISTFTRRDAERFLDDNPGACVQYARVGDTILFEPTSRTSATLRRPRALLRRVASAAAVGLMASGPALASSDAVDDGPTLVEWVASWWVAPQRTRGEVVPVEPVVEEEPAAPLIPEVGQPAPAVELGKVKPVRQPVRIRRGKPVRRTPAKR